MSTLRWRTIPYERALPKPIRTAHGAYRERAGFLVQVLSETGGYGLGDVAPLPGFSQETLEGARAAWEKLNARSRDVFIPNDATQLAAVSSRLGLLPPSVQFGVESALADCAAREQGMPLSTWLNSDAASRVSVNGLISEQSTDAAVAALRAKYRDGYRCFKVKAGVDEVDQDIQRIRALCHVLDDVRIRVDVNGGWNEEQLRTACGGWADADLEFIEQPLAPGSAETARCITREFGIGLALDEEVSSVEFGMHLLRADLCDVIVIKPMMVGGLTGALQLARAASESGKRIVLTSAWESDVGVAATLHLCAAGGDTAGTAGLSTAGMIAEGLVEPALTIANAALAISDQPGIGLTLAGDVT